MAPSDGGLSPLTAAWIATMSLTVNVLIGDAIVWWRACVLWRSRLMYCLGPAILIIGLALELLGATIQAKTESQVVSYIPDIMGAHPYGAIVTGLSLIINLLATSLIGIKAWRHRASLQGHFADNTGRQYVFKVLALLVETGVVYSATLIVSTVYLAVNQVSSRPGRAFSNGYEVFTFGCIVPMIAIYQMLIIFVIALDRSQLEHTIQQDDDSNVTLTQVTGAVSVTESTEWGSGYTVDRSTSRGWGKRP
ncbi:hypothetical protein BD311DRAFT_779453 [Dichomitus squalens]|uniref:Uncharacterized protein n=1 Tax=Dichomitus squalens TaxID=114155 RepID=A0A4Q9MH18_9APHY|nr:hypothetical protein BD311DRAFT_779453 [Dichomitus squalens]